MVTDDINYMISKFKEFTVFAGNRECVCGFFIIVLRVIKVFDILYSSKSFLKRIQNYFVV